MRRALQALLIALGLGCGGADCDEVPDDPCEALERGLNEEWVECNVPHGECAVAVCPGGRRAGGCNDG